MHTANDTDNAAHARRWFTLAVGVLILAGFLALALVVGRMPPFDRFVTDPMFFKRCLVVHVNLSLVVWFQAFTAALLHLLPYTPGPVGERGVYVSAVGVAMMVLSAPLSGEPILANYVPIIDHPLYLAGLAVTVGGVVGSVVDWRPEVRRPSADTSSFIDIPESAAVALRAAGLALVLAGVTFITSFAATDPTLPAAARFENLFWGTGHVLQLASETAMIAVWLILVHQATGHSPVSARAAKGLCALLLVPWAWAPAMAAAGTDTGGYRVGFSELMRWAIFPAVTVLLVACVVTLLRHRHQINRFDPRVWGFGISAALTMAGFILGAMIRGSNTMVPAHYHAAIGGVTAAFMTMSYVWMPAMGLSLSRGRRGQAAVRWQPVLFGAGQLVFALGFGWAGAHGMARKAYGAEQAQRGLEETLGLVVMGGGGLVAAAGGMLFLGIVGAAWWRRLRVSWRPEIRGASGGPNGRGKGEWSHTPAPETDGQPMGAAGDRVGRAHSVLHGVGLDRARKPAAGHAAVTTGSTQ